MINDLCMISAQEEKCMHVTSSWHWQTWVTQMCIESQATVVWLYSSQLHSFPSDILRDLIEGVIPFAIKHVTECSHSWSSEWKALLNIYFWSCWQEIQATPHFSSGGTRKALMKGSAAEKLCFLCSMSTERHSFLFLARGGATWQMSPTGTIHIGSGLKSIFKKYFSLVTWANDRNLFLTSPQSSLHRTSACECTFQHLRALRRS